MRSTMMDVPLSLNHLLERAGTLFRRNEIVSRLPDKTLRTHSYGEFYRRTRALAAALQRWGCRRATASRRCAGTTTRTSSATSAFRPPAASMHTLNLRLSPDEIGWIAARRAGPLPDRRRHPAAAVSAVRRGCTRSRR